MGAIKKGGLPPGMLGMELRKLIKALEQEEKSTIALGETAGPLLDLYETADDVIIEADLPGMDPDNIEVTIMHGFLTVQGFKRERIDEPGRITYLCMERSFEAFKRVIKIGVPINPRQGKASYHRGVLTVSFPKVKDKRGEEIVIKVEKTKL